MENSFLAKIVALDRACLRTFHSIPLPKMVSWMLIALVRIGDGWIWTLIALYLWLVLPLPQLKLVVLHCLVALGISLALYWPVKLLVRRARPFDAGLEVVPKVPPLDKYSFPSGHTMNNMAVALTLGLYFPHIMLLALFIPMALGVLRILFGVHFLSDIGAGALLGGLSFFLAKLLFASVPF
jgi:undecaprenyl-diphosphatase